jgi:hypothetical protein
MNNISFWKKIKLFRLYKKTIKNHETQLQAQFNIRIDKASRMYTVLNIPDNIFGENFSVRTSDINIISQNFIKDYTNSLSVFLNSKGLNELYDFYDIRKVDKYSYLIIYGFSLFKSNNFIMNFYKSIPFVIGGLILACIIKYLVS